MIGKTLAHYEITSQLGKGGMGEVYRAKDQKLGRDVAIKVLPKEFAEDADRVARFQREAKLLASLNHPNIAAIYGLEEFDGTQFLVLELVEGNTLADQLKRGSIPVAESLKLASQIVTALEAAHKKGIIHRDLKPQNILVTDEGLVKLLDFGLARLYERDALGSRLSTETVPATQTGAVLGTIAYMSPEQAQGQPADVRSDIFSLGLVLYEMLSGRRAFSGETPVATALALVKDEPDPIQTSPPLEKILRRCLAKQPSARYQTVSEVKTALEQVFAEKASATSAKHQASIAVLPFVNMSGDKEQEYFSDGLAEEVINALAHIRHLKVIARTSAFAFKGKNEDIRRIAEALNVENILEGSVRKAGNRIRITAQLIAAADGSHLWSERYDREMTDIFAIQDDITQAIVDALRIRLSPEDVPISRCTPNLPAHEAYLRGVYHFERLELDRGMQLLKEAATLDPSYTAAWERLARGYWYLLFFNFLTPKNANDLLNEAVQHALALDPESAEAYGYRAQGKLYYEWDCAGAEADFRRALQLNPNHAELRHFFGHFLMVVNKGEEGLAECMGAVERDPLGLILTACLGWHCLFSREFDAAVEPTIRALRMDPEFFWAHLILGWAHQQQGRLDEAIVAYRRAVTTSADAPLAIAALVHALATAGHVTEARQLMEQLERRARTTYVSAYDVAAMNAGLGDHEAAFAALDRAVNERASFLVHIEWDPRFDPLRADSRFDELLRRIGLPRIANPPTAIV